MSENRPKEIVLGFLTEVRSGAYPERAAVYMASQVLAHQLNAEAPVTIHRTPEDYADHVRDFIAQYGRFTLEVTETIAENDKVYARWIQYGKHIQKIDGYLPTGRTLVEYTSVVYRVEDNKIVEYWLQTDRMGMQLQLSSAVIKTTVSN